MAPATRTAPSEAAEGEGRAVVDLAAVLAAVLAGGGQLNGVAADALWVRTVDGRMQSLELPAPAVRPAAGAGDGDDDAVPDDPLTDMERDVLTVVDRMPAGTVLTTEEISRKAGFSNSGPLREFLKSLARAGRLRRARQGYERVF